MLSKSICKKCWKKYLHPNFSTIWSEIDEVNWNRGIVWCPEEYSLHQKASTRKPPKWCVHKLEHAVAAGMSNVK